MIEAGDYAGGAGEQAAVSWAVSSAEGDALTLTLNGTDFQIPRLVARAIGMALVERSTVDTGSSQPANDPSA